MQFSELSLREELQRAVHDMGFAEATTIQSEAIPPILEGRDVTGRSSTGTGKTAAFGIPAAQLAIDAGKNSVLVLCPTRELAMQTAEEVRKLCKYLSAVSVATVYGGQQMDLQIRQLRQSKIVIGTPGRVMDHLRRKTLKLDQLKMIVLDEADEMLNMGFIDDIRTILESAPAERQTVLFSATMPPAIMKLTQDFQTDPVLVAVDGGKKTVANIEQSYYNIPQGGKNDTLKLLLEYHRPKRALVFCNTKKMVDELCANLAEAGYRAAALHGDMKQSQRTSVMQEFKSGRATILIATDVAARGIDVDDVEAVFNYDIPQEYEYYIHRIGRTGRAGRAGASYTLVANKAQLMRVREIERYIKAEITPKPVPTLESIQTFRRDTFASDLRRAVDENEGFEWLKFVESLEREGVDVHALAATLCAKLQHKNKRLATVRNVTAIVGDKTRRVSTGNNAWVRASIGSSAQIGPNFIVGAIVEATGLNATDIGKINIYGDYTDIELSHEHAALVLEEMKETKIKKMPVTFTASEGDMDSGRGKGRGYAKPFAKNGRHTTPLRTGAPRKPYGNKDRAHKRG